MRKTVALLLVMALAPATAFAHDHKGHGKSAASGKGGLEIVHPWTSAMLEATVKNVAIYMTIKNTSKSAIRLVGAKTDLAEKAELIEPQIQSGIKMPMVVAALTIPPRGQLDLNSSGPRLLLSGFKKKLNAADSFELVLIFEKARPITVTVVTGETDAAERPHKH